MRLWKNKKNGAVDALGICNIFSWVLAPRRLLTFLNSLRSVWQVYFWSDSRYDRRKNNDYRDERAGEGEGEGGGEGEDSYGNSVGLLGKVSLLQGNRVGLVARALGTARFPNKFARCSLKLANRVVLSSTAKHDVCLRDVYTHQFGHCASRQNNAVVNKTLPCCQIWDREAEWRSVGCDRKIWCTTNPDLPATEETTWKR